MTKFHMNDVETETLADETHTPQPMSTRSPSTLTQKMAGLTLNDSNQAPSTLTEQTSGVLSQVNESKGFRICPVPSGRIEQRNSRRLMGSSKVCQTPSPDSQRQERGIGSWTK